MTSMCLSVLPVLLHCYDVPITCGRAVPLEMMDAAQEPISYSIIH